MEQRRWLQRGGPISSLSFFGGGEVAGLKLAALLYYWLEQGQHGAPPEEADGHPDHGNPDPMAWPKNSFGVGILGLQKSGTCSLAPFNREGNHTLGCSGQWKKPNIFLLTLRFSFPSKFKKEI